MRRFLLRLHTFLRPEAAERELRREVDAHLALITEEFVRRGLAPDEARRAARQAFGSVEAAKEAQRDTRSFRWLDDTRRDVGYAARTLGRVPGFTAAAIATLALGIGGVTLIYSVIHHVLVAPFPYPDADRMVNIRVVTDQGGWRGQFSADEFLDYQEQSDAFERVIGTSTESMHYVGDTRAERLSVAWVTPEMFVSLGVQPVHGRYFGPADAEPQAPSVTVLNYRTWMSVFGGDPAIVGRAIALNDETRTVIGVMPPRFQWHSADLWMPTTLSRTGVTSTPRAFGPRGLASGDSPSGLREAMAARDAFAGRGRQYQFQAMLRPGATVEEAEAQLNVIVGRRMAAFPQEYQSGSRAQVVPLVDSVGGRFRGVLYILLAAVSLLLLIACCNVANMLLARMTTREREIAVRAALGASRSRIVRQLLTESVMLAAGGIVVGCVLAYVGVGLIGGWVSRLATVPPEVELRLDLPVLLMALAAGAFSTLIFGVLPALHGARRTLVAGANGAGRTGTSHRQQRRARHGLVVAEVALSLVLLLGAGLLLRGFLQRMDVDLGFDPRNIHEVRLTFPPGPARAPVERQAFDRDVLDRIGRIPGVQAAAIVSALPLASNQRTSIGLIGDAVQDGRVHLQFCTEGFPEMLGVRLAAGRPLSASDVAASRKVVLVNEALANRYFGAESPLGRSIWIDHLAERPTPVDDPVFEIVGVVQNFANATVGGPSEPEVYVPYTFRQAGLSRLLVRSSADAGFLLPSVREQVRAVDGRVAVTVNEALGDWLDMNLDITDHVRFSLIVSLMFAGVGLGLVGLGVYGVVAYTVSQQTREFAIRLALGGERRQIVAQVLRMTLWLVGTGVVVGLGAGLLTGRVLTNQIWNTSPNDPIAFVIAGVVVLLLGICACAVPAWRAMRVEPAVALRHE